MAMILDESPIFNDEDRWKKETRDLEMDLEKKLEPSKEFVKQIESHLGKISKIDLIKQLVILGNYLPDIDLKNFRSWSEPEIRAYVKCVYNSAEKEITNHRNRFR